jgi:RNA polymerase sigma-70 factor (ECF subfamily)
LTGVIQNEDLGHLEEQLQTLDEGERELLRLRFAGDMRYKEIALLVDKTPGAVKIAIYRLLDQLKADMEQTNGTK